MYAGISVARKIPLVGGIGWVGKAERKEGSPSSVAKDNGHIPPDHNPMLERTLAQKEVLSRMGLHFPSAGRVY